MNIFKVSGYAAIGLILTAAIIPGLAVPALFLAPVALCIWTLGECLPQEEPTKEVTLKKQTL